MLNKLMDLQNRVHNFGESSVHNFSAADVAKRIKLRSSDNGIYAAMRLTIKDYSDLKKSYENMTELRDNFMKDFDIFLIEIGKLDPTVLLKKLNLSQYNSAADKLMAPFIKSLSTTRDYYSKEFLRSYQQFKVALWSIL